MIVKLRKDLDALLQEFHEYQREEDMRFLNLPEEKRRVIVTEIELELPDNMRLTYTSLMQLKRGTAQDVADITGRARANESMYLHFFEVYGMVKSEQVGKKKVYIFPEIKH
jgi:hypothetical protein